MHRTRRLITALAVLGFIVAGVYEPAIGGPFFFDDLRLDALLRAHPRQGLERFWESPLHPGRQLTYATFSLDYLAHGLEPPGFHVVNVVLHALNALVVFALIRMLLVLLDGQDDRHSFRVSLGAAALFAAHPLLTSCVNYTVQRALELATLFYVVGLLTFQRALNTGGWLRHGWTAATALSFWLAIRSKPIALTLPVMWAGLWWLESRRQGRNATSRLPLAGALCLLLSYIAAGVYLEARAPMETTGHATAMTEPEDSRPGTAARKRSGRDPARDSIIHPGTGALERVRLQPAREAITSPSSSEHASARPDERTVRRWTYFLTEAKAGLYYWRSLLLPLSRWLNLDHDFPLEKDDDLGTTTTVLLPHLAAWVLALLLFRRGLRLAATGIAWFYVTMSPYLVAQRPDILVDYKAYLPAVGMAMVYAEALRRLHARSQHARVLAPIWAATLLLFVAGARARNSVYQSQIDLWNDAVRKSPQKVRPWMNLGTLYVQAGDLEAARHCFAQALALAPSDPTMHLNLAHLYLRQRDVTKAESVYLHGLRAVAVGDPPAATPQSATALRLELALLYKSTGRPEQSVPLFQEVLSSEPTSWRAQLALGQVFLSRGELSDAHEHLEQAVGLAPASLEAHRDLARVLLSRGDPMGALAQFKQAVTLRPNDSDLYNDIGVVHARMGAYDAARHAFERALELRPGHDKAIRNLLKLPPGNK